MNQIVFATPLKKFNYLAGRFLIGAGGSHSPAGRFGGDSCWEIHAVGGRGALGPRAWAAHGKAILVFAIPTTLFIASIIFAIAVLTRSTVVSFTGGLVLLRDMECPRR